MQLTDSEANSSELHLKIQELQKKVLQLEKKEHIINFLDSSSKTQGNMVNNVKKVLESQFTSQSISSEGNNSMSVIMTILETKKNIAAGIFKFLEQNPGIFDQVLKESKNGEWLDNFEKDWLKNINEAITPAVALAIKTQLKMSNRKYKLLRSILQRRYNHETQRYETRNLKTGQKFPKLFPPLEKVVELQKSLHSVSAEKISNGYRQSMRDLIINLLQISELRNLMHIENNVLKLKVGCDGFKLTRYQCKNSDFFSLLLTSF
jgi:hypothetical protein